MPATTSPPVDRTPAWLLAASAILLLFTCMTLAWDYSQHSVQMDLSAFYAAGESLRLGLDPYTNNYPAVVTGTDFMRYSGFLYPPLTGLLFKAGAAFSYLKFKQLWDFSQILWVFGTGAVVFAWLRRSGYPSTAVSGVTLFFMATSAAFPLRIELERGQVDLLLLLLLTGGLLLIEVSGRAFLGGLLLGVAPLLKPHALYLLPFLLPRRRYSAIAGSVLSLVVLVGVQYAIFPALSREYVVEVLPRMDGTAASAPAEWVKVSPEEWERLSRPTWDQPVERGGHTYLREGFDSQLSVANASLARNIFLSAPQLARVGRSRISVAVYTILFLIIVWAMRSPAIRWSPQRTLAFWIMALGVVLMAAPLTWTMATVWLLPAAAMIPAIVADDELRAERKPLILGILVAGVLLTLIDARGIYFELDRRGPAALLPLIKTGIFVIRLKPVIAEILVCAGLGLYVRSRPEGVASGR